MTTKTPPHAWQERLLPLMARMLIGLTVFFFVASFVQLFYLHTRIENAPTIDVGRLLRTVGAEEPLVEAERLAIQQANTAAALEVNVIERRHHQANVLLMARVWTNYLGFVTGMTIALVGAAFILGQLKEVDAELKATVAGRGRLVGHGEDSYARVAVAQAEAFTANRCGALDGGRWQTSYNNHFAWCASVGAGPAQSENTERQRLLNACTQ